MNTKLCLAIFAMIAVPFGTGCFLVPDDALDDIKNELPQSKNTLRIDAIADGSGKTHIAVCVADPVVCRDAEGLFSAAMGNEAPMDLPFIVDYKEGDGSAVGRFQGDLMGQAEGSTITVTHKDDPKTASTATLPAPAKITAPADNSLISLATDEIKLTWDSSGGADPMEWSASVECSTPNEISPTQIDDTGEIVIDPAKLNLKAGETCKVTLHLSRWRDGTIEPAYKDNGLITAKQTRSVTIDVMAP